MKQNTPEEMGNIILGIFKKYKVRPNEILQQGQINVQMGKLDLVASDVNNGIEWLYKNEYIYTNPQQRGVFFLSELGFEKM